MTHTPLAFYNFYQIIGASSDGKGVRSCEANHVSYANQTNPTTLFGVRNSTLNVASILRFKDEWLDILRLNGEVKCGWPKALLPEFSDRVGHSLLN